MRGSLSLSPHEVQNSIPPILRTILHSLYIRRMNFDTLRGDVRCVVPIPPHAPLRLRIANICYQLYIIVGVRTPMVYHDRWYTPAMWHSTSTRQRLSARFFVSKEKKQRIIMSSWVHPFGVEVLYCCLCLTLLWSKSRTRSMPVGLFRIIPCFPVIADTWFIIFLCVLQVNVSVQSLRRVIATVYFIRVA